MIGLMVKVKSTVYQGQSQPDIPEEYEIDADAIGLSDSDGCGSTLLIYKEGVTVAMFNSWSYAEVVS
jgi:hypothetical protein